MRWGGWGRVVKLYRPARLQLPLTLIRYSTGKQLQTAAAGHYDSPIVHKNKRKGSTGEGQLAIQRQELSHMLGNLPYKHLSFFYTGHVWFTIQKSFASKCTNIIKSNSPHGFIFFLTES